METNARRMGRVGERGQTDKNAGETLFHEHAQGQAWGPWGPRE